MTAQLKIGDVVPLAVPIDDRVRAVIKSVRFKRGQLERADASGQDNQQVKQARVILDDHRQHAERRADPIEQAKAHLRRRGLIVYAGPVHGHPDGTWVVGTNLRTTAEMFDHAERLGWERPEGLAANDDIAAAVATGTSLSLHQRVEIHLRKTGMSATALGRIASNNNQLVACLRRGGSLRPHTERQLRAWLEKVGA